MSYFGNFFRNLLALYCKIRVIFVMRTITNWHANETFILNLRGMYFYHLGFFIKVVHERVYQNVYVVIMFNEQKIIDIKNR